MRRATHRIGPDSSGNSATLMSPHSRVITQRSVATSRPIFSFVRSRVTAPGFAALAMLPLVAIFLATDVFDVPFNARGGVVRALPVIALLSAIPVSMMIIPASKELERRSRRLILLRLGWGVTISSICAYLVVGSAGIGHAHGLIAAARNSFGGAGLVLIFAVAVGVRLAWLPILALAGATFVLGVDYRDVVYGWAVTLRPADDMISMTLALAIWLVGIGLYAIHDVRQWD